MLLSTLIQELNYEQSIHYRSHVTEFEPETAHLFRAASDAGVSGIYVFQASPAISQSVFSRVANADGLSRLITALENRFNGKSSLLTLCDLMPPPICMSS